MKYHTYDKVRVIDKAGDHAGEYGVISNWDKRYHLYEVEFDSRTRVWIHVDLLRPSDQSGES